MEKEITDLMEELYRALIRLGCNGRITRRMREPAGYGDIEVE